MSGGKNHVLVINDLFDKLRKFCDDNQNKLWFKLFFPSDLSSALLKKEELPNLQNLFSLYSLRKNWLRILKLFSFFPDPTLLDSIDKYQHLDLIEIKDPISLSKEIEKKNEIIRYLGGNEQEVEKNKASIECLSLESIEKIYFIIKKDRSAKILGTRCKNIIQKIITKNNTEGNHDDILLLLFYYLIESQQIFLPLEKEIESALLMLNDASLQKHNLDIKEELTPGLVAYRFLASLDNTLKKTENSLKKDNKVVFVDNLFSEHLRRESCLREPSELIDAKSFFLELELNGSGGPAAGLIESNGQLPLVDSVSIPESKPILGINIDTSNVFDSQKNNHLSPVVSNNFEVDIDSGRLRSTSLESQQSNTSLTSNDIDYVKLKNIYFQKKGVEIDADKFIENMQKMTFSNQKCLNKIIDLYPKIKTSSLDKLILNEDLLSGHADFLAKIKKDNKAISTEKENEIWVLVLQIILIYSDIKSIELIYDALSKNNISSKTNKIFFVKSQNEPNTLNIFQSALTLLKFDLESFILLLPNLLIKKTPITEELVKNFHKFINFFNVSHKIFEKLIKYPMDILIFFNDPITHDYFMEYQDKVISTDSVSDLYTKIKNLRSLGFSTQQTYKINEKLTLDNMSVFQGRVKTLNDLAYTPSNFNEDELNGLLTISSDNFESFIRSIDFIKFLDGDAINMLNVASGNNEKWKSTEFIFKILKKLNLNKNDCFEFLQFSDLINKTEQELEGLYNLCDFFKLPINLDDFNCIIGSNPHDLQEMISKYKNQTKPGKNLYVNEFVTSGVQAVLGIFGNAVVNHTRRFSLNSTKKPDISNTSSNTKK